MKILETLNDVVDFIIRKHSGLRGNGPGAHLYKFLKQADGTRIPIEQSSGFKVIKFTAFKENCLSIVSHASGFAFKGNAKQISSSTLFLQNLILINIYDNRAEFLSSIGIDFVYIVDEFSSNIQLLNEWINDIPSTVRARWIYKDNDVDALLDEISIGRKVHVTKKTIRPLCLDDFED